MKKRYELQFYAFYDHSGMVRHFEKMARRGWLLENIGGMLLRYREIEPQHLHFAVTYFPDVTGFEPRKPESQRQMEELCRQAGWEQAACRGQMQVFYTTEPDPVPLDTDPDTQIDVIHRTMKKNFLPSYISLSIVAAMQIVMQLVNLDSMGPVEYFSSVSWLSMFTWSGLLVLYVIELVKYRLWRKKALARAEEGLMTSSPHSLWVQIAAIVLLAVLVLSWMGSDQMGLVTVIMTGALCSFAAAMAASKLMKGLNVSATWNRIITIALATALSMAMVGGVTWFYLQRDRSKEQEAVTVPLTLADLGYVPGGDDRVWTMDSSSLLVTRLDCQHRGNGLPWLYYQVVDVHFRPLWNTCLNDLLNRDVYASHTIDSQPWDADAAWRLEDEEQSIYVLSWDDRLVYISLDEPITPAQMAVIAEKLRP